MFHHAAKRLTFHEKTTDYNHYKIKRNAADNETKYDKISVLGHDLCKEIQIDCNFSFQLFGD